MDKMVLFKCGREIEFKRNHLTDINRMQWCELSLTVKAGNF